MSNIPKSVRLQQELQRLNEGPKVDQVASGAGTVRFLIRCNLPSSQVLKRAREVLRMVVGQSLQAWPSDEHWRSILPQWFVANCQKERTEEERDQWYQWWRSLSPEEKVVAGKEERWSLLNWIYWLQPEERQWYWWDGLIRDDRTIVVAVEVDGWPFPWGSLDWLFRACGALIVEPE